MKIRRNHLEDFIYVLMCLATLGGLYLTRLAITKGIKMAFKEEEKNGTCA